MGASFGAASIPYKGSAPKIGLSIDVVKINKLAGRKEARAEVSNCALYPASFISSGDGYGTWFVSIVYSELEKDGVNHDDTAVFLLLRISQKLVSSNQRAATVLLDA
jgi:hypothetical protein